MGKVWLSNAKNLEGWCDWKEVVDHASIKQFHSKFLQHLDRTLKCLLLFDLSIIIFDHILGLIIRNEIRHEFPDTTNFQKPFRTFHNRIRYRQG